MTISQHLGSCTTTGEQAWRDEARCRDADPGLFFPTSGSALAIAQVHAAKVMCRGCPVRDACLQFALETKQEAGIWGGATEDERRRLRRAWLADRRRRRAG